MCVDFVLGEAFFSKRKHALTGQAYACPFGIAAQAEALLGQSANIRRKLLAMSIAYFVV